MHDIVYRKAFLCRGPREKEFSMENAAICSACCIMQMFQNADEPNELKKGENVRK